MMGGSRRRIVIVGATSGIATQCARLWVRQPVDLVLVGRDAAGLERHAADLRVRNPDADIQTVVADFREAAAIQAAIDAVAASGPLDIVLIAHGALPDQESCQGDIRKAGEALEINALSPVLFAEACARYMAQADRGILALIGSVAGDRGRKSNYVYGAAKSLVASYAEGLQHRFAGSGVSVVLVKPGPTDTPMTAHLKRQGARLAPVDEVARDIVSAIERRRPEVYTPAKWRLIMLVIRLMPRFVFNKLNI